MTNTLNPIQNRSTVVIIGGGPAGSSCAIKLRQLSQKMGKNLRVVLYEGKRFDEKSYYNQCLGVLSPPQIMFSFLRGNMTPPLPAAGWSSLTIV